MPREKSSFSRLGIGTSDMDAACFQQMVEEVALRELGEDERTREGALKQMRSWVLDHPNIRNCRTDDSFLLRFLRAKKYNIHNSQKMLVKFLGIKDSFPRSLTCNNDVMIPAVNELITNGFCYASPYRDDNGRRVIMINFGKLDPKQYTYQDAAKAMQVTNYTLMEEEASQVLGYTYLFDTENFSTSHLGLWPSPFEFIRYLRSGEAAIPMRNKEIHILNLPYFAFWIYKLLKAILSKKLQQRIMVHRSLEDLHKKLNPRVLPEEYGGETPMREMTDAWIEELMNKREILLGLDDMKVLSNKELKENQDLSVNSVGESLRTLQVD